MTRYRKALRSWKRNAPKQSRLPMPVEFAFLISSALCSLHSREMGLYHIALFCTYLRPSALLSLRCEDLVPAVSEVAGERWVMVIAPFEREKATKTGYFDETVVLDDDIVPQLGALLSDLAKARAAASKLQPGSEAAAKLPLWGFSAAKFLDSWRACVIHLGLEEFMISPYQTRHGGASRDYILKKRSEEEIRARGHWATVTAARIYRKLGRIQQLVARLTPRGLSLAQQIQKGFAEQYRVSSFRQVCNVVS